MFKALRVITALLIISIAATPAIACKLGAEAYDLKVFLSSPKPNKVVFLGQVKSIENSLKSKERLPTQKIQFQAERWWHGRAREVVEAEGNVGTLKGTDCEGVFDFKVEFGEEWLIVGFEEAGTIRPSGLLSKRISNHKLPPEVIQLLALKNDVH